MFLIQTDSLKKSIMELEDTSHWIRRLNAELSEVQAELWLLSGMGDIFASIDAIRGSVSSEIRSLRGLHMALDRIVWEYDRTEETITEDIEAVSYAPAGTVSNIDHWPYLAARDAEFDRWIDTILR